jgi:hypothetical protein
MVVTVTRNSGDQCHKPFSRRNLHFDGIPCNFWPWLICTSKTVRIVLVLIVAIILECEHLKSSVYYAQRVL